MQSRNGEFIKSLSTRIYYVPRMCPHELGSEETVVSKKTGSLGASIIMREINHYLGAK